MLVPRRTFLERSVAVGGAMWRIAELSASQTTDLPGFSGARLLRTMPLGRFDARPTPPLETLLGVGLDARQFTDLSTLTDKTLIVPNSRFYVRTSAPPLSPRRPWIVRLDGRVRRAAEVSVDALHALARPMGTHLLECAGNTDPANYGLMSVAEWRGVPVGALLDRVSPMNGPWRVRITGVDHRDASRSSVAGAAWVFSRDDLERSGAFLATEMNGVPLPPDHGFPVRLVVPGWYGCTCIKWVSTVELVPDDDLATSQMQEFASRTQQKGTPTRAQDFVPAVIDVAATPIRVEQWAIGAQIVYRVVGIIWGGSKPTTALAIRFRHDQSFVAVDRCPLPVSTSRWSLWSHMWRPDAPGTYQIVLRVTDPAIRTRRLDFFGYTRDVQIDEATRAEAR